MSERYEAVVRLIDAANAADPNRTSAGEGERPAALVYGERMSERLQSFLPEASEHLRIAVRAQHLERWTLPRSAYPMDRPGYLGWRNEQKRRHAARVAELMAQAGYPESDRSRVASLVRKEGLKRDTEAQALEDVACLVFLEHYLAEFAGGRPPEQLVDIVAKTWRKISETGRKAALRLQLPDDIGAVIREGVAKAGAA
jgi:hypothetical protein